MSILYKYTKRVGSGPGSVGFGSDSTQSVKKGYEQDIERRGVKHYVWSGFPYNAVLHTALDGLLVNRGARYAMRQFGRRVLSVQGWAGSTFTRRGPSTGRHHPGTGPGTGPRPGTRPHLV